MNTNFNGVSRQNLGIETAPHLKAPLTTKMIMGIVSLCLLPAFLVQIFFFGFGNFFQFINCLITAIVCEVVIAILRHRSVLHSLSDLSYVVTAALLGMTLPPLLPCYYAIVATVFAIIVVKAVFGGLGNNIFNPAMAGFVFIVISSPSVVGLSWVAPAPFAFSVASLEKTAEVIYDKKSANALKKEIDALNITLLDENTDESTMSNTDEVVVDKSLASTDTDATTGATFLEEIKSARKSGTLYKKTNVDFQSSEYLAYFCLAIAYLLGGLALIAFKIILVKMVVVFFVAIVAFSLLLSHIFPGYFLPPLDTLLFGGTMMAAFFIITDPVTNAGTSKGRIYFSILVAFLIVLLRAFGSYSDAVAFAIMKNTNVETLLGTNEKETKRMNKGLRSLLSGVSLAIVGSLCVGLVLYVENTTKDQIAENQKNSIDARVLALLPDEAKDKGNQITCYQIKKSKYIGSNQKLFVASRASEITGYVMTYETSMGYSNPLVMIAGFDKDKKVYKADIQFSLETPGLGDKVDRAHGNFLDQFSGYALEDANWDVKKLGGDFDYITGSTVTSRATVVATSMALKELNELDLNRFSKCRTQN